jgi:hypothetical protein
MDRIGIVLLAFLALVSCQSPTGSPSQPPRVTLAGGSFTLKNGGTTGLTLSAFDPQSPAQAVVSAPLVAAGQSAVITTIPSGHDWNFKALDDLATPTAYSLVKDGVPAIFRLSPDRAYELGFSLDSTVTPPMVWSWALTDDPRFEVSGLKVVPGTNSLTLTWTDPSFSDLASVSVTVGSQVPVPVAKGVQSLTVTSLTGNLPVQVKVQAVYPEIASRGVAATATPKASAVVVVPQVWSVYPSDAANQVSPGQSVSVDFSTAIDLASVGPQTFSVTDGTTPVAGTYSCASPGYTVVFTPLVPMPASKTLHATVTTGIRSVSGGSLAAATSWSFTTSSLRVPTVSTYSVSPVRQAIEVATTGTTITVDLYEPLWAPSVNSTTVQVSDGTSLVPGTVSLANSGYRIVFTPTALPANKTITVTLTTGILSQSGGALAAPFSWSFETLAPSPYQDAQTLVTGSPPSAVAIGDVTGDGVSDIVTVTRGGTGTTNTRLVVFPQGAGTAGFGTPVYYATKSPGDNLCGVAVGDVNGDGKNEVVVAELDGIEVFSQDGKGGLVSTSRWTTDDSAAVIVADLNSDHRMDIAGIGSGNNLVSVWTQTAGGGLSAEKTYTATAGGWNSLVAADVNGDGRTDLVVMSGQSFVPNVEILYQSSTGTLGTQVPFSLDPQNSSSGIGVGDLNGDGKADLVLSYGGNRPGASLGFFLQTSSGLPATPTSQATYEIPGPLLVTDLNGDGRQDLLVVHQGWGILGTYYQLPDGTLDHERYSMIGQNQAHTPTVLAVADLNGDTRPDVVTLNDKGVVLLYGK